MIQHWNISDILSANNFSLLWLNCYVQPIRAPRCLWGDRTELVCSVLTVYDPCYWPIWTVILSGRKPLWSVKIVKMTVKDIFGLLGFYGHKFQYLLLSICLIRIYKAAAFFRKSDKESLKNDKLFWEFFQWVSYFPNIPSESSNQVIK